MTQYYVDPINGLDANSGSLSLPWKTVFHATSRPGLLPGDTINLAAGIYDNDTMQGYSGVSGTAGNPITVQALSGAVTIIPSRLTGYWQVDPDHSGMFKLHIQDLIDNNILDAVGRSDEWNYGPVLFDTTTGWMVTTTNGINGGVNPNAWSDILSPPGATLIGGVEVWASIQNVNLMYFDGSSNGYIYFRPAINTWTVSDVNTNIRLGNAGAGEVDFELGDYWTFVGLKIQYSYDAFKLSGVGYSLINCTMTGTLESCLITANRSNCDSFLMDNCHIDKVGMTPVPAGGSLTTYLRAGYCHGIYQDADATNSIVRNSYFGDCSGEMLSWRSGSGNSFYNNTGHNTVGGLTDLVDSDGEFYNNLLYCSGHASGFGAYASVPSDNLEIHHNTIILDQTWSPGIPIALNMQGTRWNVHDNIFRVITPAIPNIFYGVNSGNVPTSISQYQAYTVDNNIWWVTDSSNNLVTTAPPHPAGGYNTPSEWTNYPTLPAVQVTRRFNGSDMSDYFTYVRNTYGWDTNSVFADPLLDSAYLPHAPAAIGKGCQPVAVVNNGRTAVVNSPTKLQVAGTTATVQMGDVVTPITNYSSSGAQFAGLAMSVGESLRVGEYLVTYTGGS